jgi:hypothetical protein
LEPERESRETVCLEKFTISGAAEKDGFTLGFDFALNDGRKFSVREQTQNYFSGDILQKSAGFPLLKRALIFIPLFLLFIAVPAALWILPVIGILFLINSFIGEVVALTALFIFWSFICWIASEAAFVATETIVFICNTRKNNLKKWHGAEHKAANFIICYYLRLPSFFPRSATLADLEKMDIFSYYCGTREICFSFYKYLIFLCCLLLFFFVSLASSVFFGIFLAIWLYVLSVGISYCADKLFHPFYKFLQKKFFVSEPDREQLEEAGRLAERLMIKMFLKLNEIQDNKINVPQ